ncbi:hypothetical protein NDA02_10320 [Leptolyngbya sp. ST-U4]
MTSQPSSLLIRQARILLPDGTFTTGDVHFAARRSPKLAVKSPLMIGGKRCRSLKHRG